MANNLLKRIVMILVLTFTAFSLYAFDKKFEQKLSWTGDENVFEYKVEIAQDVIQNEETAAEDLSGGVSKENKIKIIKSITTKESFVTVNLAAGYYKYRVIAYDFLQRESSVTQWRTFEVIKAMEPELELAQNEVEVKKNQKKGFELPVDMKQITSESKVELVNEKTGEVYEGKVLDKETEDGFKIVNFPRVADGNWKIKVTNPSGLSKETEESVTVKTKEPKKINWPIDLNIMAGAGFDFNVQKAFQNIENNFAVSPTLKVSYLPIDVKQLKFGLELNAQYMNRKNNQQYYSFNMDYIYGTCSVVGRFNLANGLLGINAKIGGGLMLCNFEFQYHELITSRDEVPKQSFLEGCFTAGLSVNVCFAKHVIIEAGADYILMFMGSANEGFISPYICAGVRF